MFIRTTINPVRLKSLMLITNKESTNLTSPESESISSESSSTLHSSFIIAIVSAETLHSIFDTDEDSDLFITCGGRKYSHSTQEICSECNSFSQNTHSKNLEYFYHKVYQKHTV